MFVLASRAVFGFSLAELFVVIVVALVVIGPKELPQMLRKLGHYSGKLRRMAADLRAQSGIDEALRTEGLAEGIAEIRKLARGELDDVRRSVIDTTEAFRPAQVPAVSAYADHSNEDVFIVREREYPRDGADSNSALPDNAIVYVEGLPPSKFAADPLYMLGDPEGVIPVKGPPEPVDDTHRMDPVEQADVAPPTEAAATTTASAINEPAQDEEMTRPSNDA